MGNFIKTLDIYKIIAYTESMNKDLWMAVRQALLMIVDAIERELQITPRTSTLRKETKHS